MSKVSRRSIFMIATAAAILCGGGAQAAGSAPQIDRSGKARIGTASFYARMFTGRKMANGNIMNPTVNNAASRTLPLGTIARVTNLRNGKSAVITIQDRGPYVGRRLVDLSPATARQIGITPRAGLARVEVAPISVPLPDGSIRFGAAAPDIDLANNLQGYAPAGFLNW
jgi:rare lipoprotein A